ncbi:MAG TPA: hypothetical protein VGD74_07825, partial [Vulgatibacter sp.]
MRLLLLGTLALALAGGCRHRDAAPPPGEGLAELRWRFEPGPGEQGMPAATVVLRYDGTGTLDTGDGPRAFTLGPLAMSGIVGALDGAKPFAGKVFGDPACATKCTHNSLEVKPVRGASWSLARHGKASPAAIDEVFFRL